MRKCWHPAFFPFFTMFSTPLRDQSHSFIHILFVLCRRFRLMNLKFYCLVIHISHKTFEIGCAWSKGSCEQLQGHYGPLVCSYFLVESYTSRQKMETLKPSLCSSLVLLIILKSCFTQVGLQISKTDDSHLGSGLDCIVDDLAAQISTQE